MKNLLTILLISISVIGVCQEAPEFRFHGLKIFVDDLENAEVFYTQILGFEIKDKKKNHTELVTGSWPIYLYEVKGSKGINNPYESRTSLAIQTYKLLPRINELHNRGIKLYDSLLTRNGVGISIPFEDASGNLLNLIEVQIRDIPSFENMQIYNTGVTIGDMETAIKFYIDILGFEEWSKAYLPNALPLKHSDGSFAFMIHYNEQITQRNSLKYGTDPQMILILETSNMDTAKSYLSKYNLKVSEKDNVISCKDFEDNYLEIIPGNENNLNEIKMKNKS